MNCALCGEKWHGETVPFSSVCEACCCWLHSCIQCSLWDPLAQMCRSMTTDSVADRRGKNFCEEWKPGDNAAKTDTDNNSGRKFESLFGD